MGNEDIHLHVQHQHGTGGHWCAKIIFFALMAVLLGLVGLIIMENRGLEDLDTPLSESRYSNYFDGWVEEHRHEDEHDAHPSHEAALDKHDVEHDDEHDDEHNEHDDEHEDEHDDEHDEEHDEEDEEEAEEEDEEEGENTAAENVTAEDDEDDNDDGDENKDDDEVEASLEPPQSAAYDEEEDDVDEDEEDDDDIEESIEPPVSQSKTQSAPETAEDDDDFDDEEEEEADEDDDIEEPTTSQSQPETAEDQNEDDVDEDADDNDDEEIEESTEPIVESAPNAADNDDDDDDFDQDDNDDDDDDFESLDQDVDNDADEELLLQERQRQAAAAEKAKQQQEQDKAAEEEIPTISSWLGSQIKPREPTGAKAVEHDEDLFEQELRKANAEMINEKYANALRAFNTLTHTYAHKPAAHLARAQALELMAERQHSNRLLLDAIESYKRYLAFDELIANHSEYRAAGERCIEQLRFLGHIQQAVFIHEQLIERFPTEAQLRNQLSLTHLMSNNLVQLQQVAGETLKLWPSNPVANLHYGLALKQLLGDYAQAVPHLQHAIDSQAKGTQEPFFYLALGESLQRLGKQAQALKIYQRGAEKRFFASVYQRSLYNEPKLRAKPFWQPVETGYAWELEQLQQNWRQIRKEALSLLSGQSNFQQESEQLRDTGNWQQYELYAQGKRLQGNCQRAPITCALIEKFPAARSCSRGQIKFSAMQAETHVWPHCGPTNCRLRAHLTLAAPEPHLTSLRVAEDQRTWREGDFFIFDDSFEHEVWHNGTQLRLVLIIDIWHPDLSAAQRRNLAPI